MFNSGTPTGDSSPMLNLEDDTFVNARLAEHGCAQMMTAPPNVKYQELFLKLQGEAREARWGLWR